MKLYWTMLAMLFRLNMTYPYHNIDNQGTVVTMMYSDDPGVVKEYYQPGEMFDKISFNYEVDPAAVLAADRMRDRLEGDSVLDASAKKFWFVHVVCDNPKIRATWRPALKRLPLYKYSKDCEIVGYYIHKGD